MKKKYFKSIFKDKSFIKMICFTIVLLFVLVLGNTFGYVSADDTGYLLNITDYRASSINDSSVPNDRLWFGGNISENSALCYEFYTSELDISNLSFPSNFDISSISGFAVFGSSYSSLDRVYLFPDETFLYVGSGTYYGSMIMIKGSDTFFMFEVGNYGDGTNLQSKYVIDNSFTVLHATNYVEIGGDRYYQFNVGDQNNLITYSNVPYYSYTNATSDSVSAYEYIVDYLENGTTTYVRNINYMVDNAGLKGFDNTYPSTPEYGETSLNNLTMTSADWWLNRVGSTGLNRFLGSVTFQGSLTDYQLEHPDEFIVQYSFEGELDFFYQNSYSTELSASFPFLGESLDASLGVDGEASAELQISYDNYYVQQSLSDFIDSGYQKQFPLMTDIYKNMDANGTYDYEITITSGIDKHYEGSIDADLSVYDVLSLANSENFAITDWKTFDLVCSAQILSADYLEGDNGNNVASGWYTETFNLLNGTSTINDSSLLQNDNPYIENTGGITDNTNLPSNNTSGSSSVTQTTGAVTQNVTVTNSGAQYIPSLISKLIPTSLGDTGTGLVSTFSTMAQTNGFISVMASTVPAIPSTVWTYLTNYLGISLYLLACAFVLRLILDLL